jgi:hypothetical protein
MYTTTVDLMEGLSTWRAQVYVSILSMADMIGRNFFLLVTSAAGKKCR